ncbi:hypothetical protein U9M48_022965 [Paspalum notatum var. saurae]|uniref:EGF-like domain-containing protein n=1 Tax=Paspalum notatum var. saurae TaxID=547442 RepID=A0AAQ3TNF9_PASNO
MTSLFVDGVVLSLLLLAFAAAPTAEAAVSAHNGYNASLPLPSSATLAGCQRNCGNLTFDYPFGIGSQRCFRDPDFKLICSNDTTQTPRLFLNDGITEVVDDGFDITSNFIYISFSYSIPMISGVNEYNKSWKAPGRHFALEYTFLNITGCDFDAYQLLDQDTSPMLLCAVTCPNKEITETVARHDCNGTGCCSVLVPDAGNSFQLKFVRKEKGRVEHGEDDPSRSSLWDRINVTTVFGFMTWSMLDQSTCASTLVNNTNYACISNNSRCYNDYSFSRGYNCRCINGYEGNPYLLDGCKRDQGYNPFPKANCSQQCGNISVPFPFGLEEGCSARKLFLLNCTNMSTSSLQLNDEYLVTYINVSEGLVGIEDTSYYKQQMYGVMIPNEPELYIGSGESASMQWAVANLTCHEAQQNKSGYACVSNNSSCLGINSTRGYIGYRCKCMPGFQGNPYIPNGCQGLLLRTQRHSINIFTF